MGIAYNTSGILPNRTPFAWGENTYGQIGNGETADQSSPVIVMGNHTFTSISAGDLHSGGLKSDGSAWCWGYNGYGGLGDNTRSQRSSPVAVVGGHVFTEINLGYYNYSLAL